MKTLVVTGFGPFPGAPRNPSVDVVEGLQRLAKRRFLRAGWRLATDILPVVYDIDRHLDALMTQERPDAVLHIGFAGARRAICVEMRAKNRVSTIKPDAHKKFASIQALSAKKPDALPVRWNVQALRAALAAQGLSVSLSQDAGDYICNATLWRTLAAADIPAVFLHMPKKRHTAPTCLTRALAVVLPNLLNQNLINAKSSQLKRHQRLSFSRSDGR